MEKGNEEGRNDRWFYIVVLFCLLICLGSLYIVKDAEQRCDQRYAPLIKECYHTKEVALYSKFSDVINLSQYPDSMRQFT